MKQFLMLCLVLVTALFPMGQASADTAQTAFDREELELFCSDLQAVLAALSPDEGQQYLVEVTDDSTNTLWQRERERPFPARLSRERFNYILNHTILAGVIKDMGGFGQGKITFLLDQKKRLEKDPKVPPEKKAAILRELDESLAQVRQLARQTEAIPKSELYLLWEKRQELNAILFGVVPIEKKKMAAH